MKISPAIEPYEASFLSNGFTRPHVRTNTWVAALSDQNPQVSLTWKEPVSIKSIYLYFDTDFDHPMESSQYGHPERQIPFCGRNYSLHDAAGLEVYRKQNNYQTIDRIIFEKAIETEKLTLKLEHPSENVTVALFEIRCYEA